MVKLALLALLGGCSGVFYQPIKGALIEPRRFTDRSPEEVKLTSSDGTRLVAWAFRADGRPRGTILQFHGNAENMSTHFLNLWWLVKEGWDLLVFDYRGYGFSEGEPDQAGVNQDALAALRWARADHMARQSCQLIVFGQSLGGQIAARAIVDFPQQKDVDLLVQDSTFPSYQGIAAQKLGSRWFLWPFYPLAYLAVSDQFASQDVLSQLQVPVLGMHATGDPVVPYELGREGFAQVKARKWWWRVKSAGHTDAFHYPKTPWRGRFLELTAQLRREKNCR